MSSLPLVVMGYAAPEGRSNGRKRMAELATHLGELAEVDVGVTPLASYDRVAQLVHHREIDLAWLSPIPLIALARNRRVIPMVSLTRDRALQYRFAFIVSTSSHMTTLEELRGKRAAWVDRHSASGYVLPRIKLAGREMIGRNLASESFFGSHEAVVRAVASGRADFGATYAHESSDGVITGAWTRMEGLSGSVRVLKKAFGVIPPDAIAARSNLDRGLVEQLIVAFERLAQSPRGQSLIADVFGAEEFSRPRRVTYEALRGEVFRAYKLGLLASDGTTDEAILGAAATLEHRSVPNIPSGTRMKAPHARHPRLDNDTEETNMADNVNVAKMRTAKRLA